MQMMYTENGLDTHQWFVLNHISIPFREKADVAVDRFNHSQGSDLELFAPTYVVRDVKNGEVKMRTVNLTFHYVFVRGRLEDVRMLCSHDNGFSFLIHHGGTERYATISDREMANFRNIARAYKNCLPYFPLDEIDLEEGDLVEVVNGDFPGLIGTYMPKSRSTSGNIILNIFNNVGTIAFDVKAKDVRVLEFSRKSTRANDQIDAIVPHLLKALRQYHQPETIPTGLIAKLSVFCRRMEIVRLNNRKLDARLKAVLYGCNMLLGNHQEAAGAKSCFEAIKDAVTNPWTRALTELIFAILDNDAGRLSDARAAMKQLQPSSRYQHQLKEEYEYYEERIEH